jgi:hypothetical protein
MDVLLLRVRLRGNVFTDSLASNWYTRHNIVAWRPVAGQRPRDKRKYIRQRSMFVPQQWETVTEERCFLCGPCRGVISRTLGAMS